jgi:hypothetical protein
LKLERLGVESICSSSNPQSSRILSIPNIHHNRRLTNFAFEDVNGCGDEFHFDFGMFIQPFVDAVVEVFATR